MTTTRADTGLGGRLAGYAAALRTAGAIRTGSVQAAFAAVPRHRFLPRFRYRADEYQLDPDTVPADDVLDLAPGLRVLEIGAGTGYNAALIHHITGADVVTIEAGRQAAAEAAAAIRTIGLDKAVHVVHGDGYDGHRDRASYERIIVTCGIAGIPPTWLDQLTPGGDAVIVAPVAHAGVHPILAVHRQADSDLTGRVLLWGDFMPAAGNPQLADHLARLVGQWDADGRPGASDWLVDWRHADTGGAGPHHWHRAH